MRLKVVQFNWTSFRVNMRLSCTWLRRTMRGLCERKCAKVVMLWHQTRFLFVLVTRRRLINRYCAWSLAWTYRVFFPHHARGSVQNIGCGLVKYDAFWTVVCPRIAASAVLVQFAKATRCCQGMGSTWYSRGGSATMQIAPKISPQDAVTLSNLDDIMRDILL